MGSVAIFKGKLVKFLAKAGILIPKRATTDRSGTPEQGETAFNTTDSKLEVWDGTSWVQLGASGGTSAYTLQQLDTTQTLTNWVNRLTPLHTKNIKAISEIMEYSTSGGAESAYSGGVYSPISNRIYFVPYAQSIQTSWHYINCYTSTAIGYTHAQTVVALGYSGGVFCPIKKRIYFVPYSQAAQSTWHYLNDLKLGSLTPVAYTHGATAVQYAYQGGVFSPTQKRIYFIPYKQALQSNWHYIDCDTGNIISYVHGLVGLVDFGYIAGAYSPTQNRIYLSPYGQSNQSSWHYIDCATGSVVAYTHGATTSNLAYRGAVFSPTQNRIYFVPAGQCAQANWHYVDCATGNIVAYAHGTGSTSANTFNGGVYVPTQNRIYFVPAQVNFTQYYYIDCSTGNVVVESRIAAMNACAGGVYSPTENAIYYVPYGSAVWCKQVFTSRADMEPHELGSTIISSTF